VRTHFKYAVAMAAMLTAVGVGFAQEAPSPAGTAPEPNSIDKFSRDFDLLPGLGRPRSEAIKPADLGVDPLGDIANGMTDVHADLSQFKTDHPVQQKEKDVVASLEKVIAALTPKQGDGSGNTPNGGRKRSGIFEGDPSFGDIHGVDQAGRQWAQLPPKERERILQSKTEGFPPGYEAVLQSYFQRLAQEKPVDDKPAETSTTQPAAR
jgi:hypothetical protein